MMLEEVMIQQRVVMIEEVMIRTLCCNLCKHSENQRGGWGGGSPPMMLEEVMIQQRVR